MKVKVTIHDPKGNKIYEKEHVLGRYGSTAGELVLGDEPALGQYRIQIQPLGETAPAIPNYWFSGMQQVGVFRVD
ncbi:MAG: hypothetical protein O7E54_08810, partial [Planctomycetota bacterium]|nr:hypothetical protein [Planctomycetota bacterium]